MAAPRQPMLDWWFGPSSEVAEVRAFLAEPGSRF